MINAIEARENVNQYRQKVYFEVAKLVRETLEEIGKSIELHSQGGHIKQNFLLTTNPDTITTVII